MPRHCAARSWAASRCCSSTSGDNPSPIAMRRARGLAGRCLALTAVVYLAIALAGCANDGGAIHGSGTIEMDEVDVASLVGGRLLRLTALEGDTVAIGDTLAVLD